MLQGVTPYTVSQGVIGCYKVLHGTRCHKVSQDVTGCHRTSQGVIRCHKVSQGVTRCYKVLQGVTQYTV